MIEGYPGPADLEPSGKEGADQKTESIVLDKAEAIEGQTSAITELVKNSGIDDETKAVILEKLGRIGMHAKEVSDIVARMPR